MAAPRAKSTLSGRACPKEELTHTAPGNRTLRAVFEPRGVLRAGEGSLRSSVGSGDAGAPPPQQFLNETVPRAQGSGPRERGAATLTFPGVVVVPGSVRTPRGT